MIGWMVRNFISRDLIRVLHIFKTVAVLKICKTLIRSLIEYCTSVWAPVSRHGIWSVILRLEGVQKRVIKIMLEIKRLQ